MAEGSGSGNEIVQVKPETQIALASNQDESLAVTPSEVVIAGGTHHGACFGSTKNVLEAHNYSNAKITHVHNVTHHHLHLSETEARTETSENGLSASGGATAIQSSQGEENKDLTKLSETISLYNREPLRKGTRIYKGVQSHVLGSRFLAIKLVAFDAKTLQEVKNLLKLAYHQNVVQIIESQVHQTVVREIYIAMELCSSQNLQDYVDKNREEGIPFDSKQTVSYSKQLVAGMKHIHENDIVHGDFKPANVLLSEDKKTLKISDFGLSKELRHGRSTTKVSTLGRGTDGYRAPECYNSDIISKRGDIFSFGCTMFSLCSNGKHPFGADLDLLNYNIKKNKGRDLSGILISGKKNDEFVDLSNQMLQHDPQQRPTIEQISEHPFISNEPTTPIEVPGQKEQKDQPCTSYQPQAQEQKPHDRSSSLDETKPKQVSGQKEEDQPCTSYQAKPQEQKPHDRSSNLDETKPKQGFTDCGSQQKFLCRLNLPEAGRQSEQNPSPDCRSKIAKTSDTEGSGQEVTLPERGKSASIAGQTLSAREASALLKRQRGWRTASEHRQLTSQEAPDHEGKGDGSKEAFFDGRTKNHPQRHTYSDPISSLTKLQQRLRRLTSRGQHRRSESPSQAKPREGIFSSNPQPAQEQLKISELRATSSSVLERIQRINLNPDKLSKWRLVVRHDHKEVLNRSVKDMDQGYRLHSGGQKCQTHSTQKVEINGKEMSIHQLGNIELPRTATSNFSSHKNMWLGVVIWFDKATSELRGINYGSTSVFFYDFFQQLVKIELDNKVQTCILSIKKCLDWLELSRSEGVSISELQGPVLCSVAGEEDHVEIEVYPCVVDRVNPDLCTLS